MPRGASSISLYSHHVSTYGLSSEVVKEALSLEKKKTKISTSILYLI